MREEEGLWSLIGMQRRGQQNVIVGLNPSNPLVKRLTKTDASPVQTLTGYFTTDANPFPLSRLGGLVVRDGFDRPSACEFVHLQEMPRTKTGEIDRDELMAISGRRHRTAAGYDEPRNDLERQVAGIWKDVLGIRELGIHDSFFKLGGHSLLATRLIARLNKSFQVDMTLAKLFEASTVARMAEEIVKHEAEPGQVAAIVRLRQKLDEMSADEIRAILQSKQKVQV